MPFGSKKETKAAAVNGIPMASPSHPTETQNFTSPLPPSKIKHMTQIGSITELVTSPDGKSIQMAPEQPKRQSTKKAQMADSTTTSPIFRNDVRQEWVNAIFGPDFFPNPDISDAMAYTPPKEGMGLANVPSYLSYTANISIEKEVSQPQSTDATPTRNKVGVTLSRIPIGVYVRIVDIESEAFAAGIVPGSILIDINGMGVLGEPSHKLLERLWVYEGHFANISRGEEGLSSKDEMTDIGPPSVTMGMFGPVSLTFIKDGQVYTTVLYSGTPFGISWAPCANFALVQRSYAFAQKAGVRRGCIVAAVNHKSLREMDHLDTAMELKEQFTKGKDIRIVCIYTPAASRTNYFISKNGVSNPNTNKANDFKSIDGVRVRKVNLFKRKQQEKPTEYGVGSFFSCGTGANYTPVTSGSEHDFISDLANRVAAGEIAAPTGSKRGLSSLGKGHHASNASFQQIMMDKALAMGQSEQAGEHTLANSLRESEKKYNSDCPLMQWTDIIPQWNYLDALILCLRMHTAEYNEEKFIAMGGVVGGSGGKSALLIACNSVESGTVALHSTSANLDLFRAIKAAPNATEVIHSFLLQIVALISSEQIHSSVDSKMNDATDDNTAREHLMKESRRASEEIIDVIVDIALHDEDLCQTLHFLLRSFSSTYANVNGGARGEVLKLAHLFLRNRLIERENSGATMPSLNSPSSVSYDGIYDYESLQSASTISHCSFAQPPSPAAVPKKSKKKLGKKFGNIFKTRSKEKKDIEGGAATSVSIINSDSFVEITSEPSSPKLPPTSKPGSKKKLGFIPTSILRKASDQAPQDNGFMGGPWTDILPTPELFENMGWFLSNLDKLCGNIERSLLKSFSQKITEWALQPWSANKDRALAESTADLRNGLWALNDENDTSLMSERHWSPVLNPMDSSEMLVSLVPDESYILPSAHFPLLLSFDSCPNPRSVLENGNVSTSRGMLHRIHVKVVSIRSEDEGNEISSYVVNAAVGGTIKTTGRSALEPYFGSTTHRWHDYNDLNFESRLSTRPSTVEINVSSMHSNTEAEASGFVDEKELKSGDEVGFALVDISNCWKSDTPHKVTHRNNILAFDTAMDFDQSGSALTEKQSPVQLSIELEITTESILLVHAKGNSIDIGLNQRRMLLYKHDEDMRQEMLAIQFINICDHIFKASGLDLKMKTYKCISVGENKGFIEWVPGAISLSEICKPMGRSSENKADDHKTRVTEPDISTHSAGDDTPTKFVRTGAWCKHESLRSLRQVTKSRGKQKLGLYGNNPIQDFLRSNAYDSDAPYFIRKDVMDNFVKSCAGYCVATYLLGVGDRHTDNLLLDPEGHFLHCDYSFILGQDPKTFLPMRITEHMVNGMGGRDSDNFAKFLSLAGAAFVSLRQPASVRVLMSLVQGMLHSHIPDISITQKPDEALKFIHQRFSLDLDDDDAVAFLEENIENSLTSKIWVAVDTLHSIGKRF